MNFRRIPLLCLLISFLPYTLQAAEPVTLKSVDGELQLSLPDGWESASLHVIESQITANNKAAHEFLILTSVESADYTDTFKSFAENNIRSMQGALQDVKTSEAKESIINGHKAMQYEVHGTLPKHKLRVAYLVTIMEMKSHLVDIAGWTTESHFAKNKADFEKLPKGLSEVEAAPAAKK